MPNQPHTLAPCHAEGCDDPVAVGLGHSPDYQTIWLCTHHALEAMKQMAGAHQISQP